MTKALILTAWGLLLCGLPTPAVAFQAHTTFEVASVKQTTLPDGVSVSGLSMTFSSRADGERLRNTGGPGTNDPGRIHYPIVTLKRLLVQAYGSFAETKGPGWVDTDVFQVDATMPPNTTPEQFREMIGNLLTDRFKLKYHVETKEIPGYSLVVGKNGPRFKESVDEPAGQELSAAVPQPVQIASDGFRIPPKGPTFGFAAAPDQRARILGQQQTMEKLAEGLGTVLKSPVTNATGLKAKYDFVVTYAGGFGRDGPYAQPLSLPTDVPDPAGLPDIFSALQSQLGLKLEPKKTPVQTMVIDHIERTPTEN